MYILYIYIYCIFIISIYINEIGFPAGPRSGPGREADFAIPAGPRSGPGRKTDFAIPVGPRSGPGRNCYMRPRGLMYIYQNTRVYEEYNFIYIIKKSIFLSEIAPHAKILVLNVAVRKFCT